MTKIIPALSQDSYQIIADLAKSIWTEHYKTIISEQQIGYMLNKFQSVSSIKKQVENGVKYFLIFHDDVTVGYFSYNKKNDSLFLSKLYILNSARGQGLGKSALSFLGSQTKKLGLNKIQLTVNKYNSIAIKAYQKMGFININAIVQDIGEGYVMDDFVFEKIV